MSPFPTPIIPGTGGRVSSSSTDAQVQASYEDNANYDVDVDVEACRDFIVAARILGIRRLAEFEKGATRMKESPTEIKDRMKEAKAWLSGQVPATSGKRTRKQFKSLRSMRG